MPSIADFSPSTLDTLDRISNTQKLGTMMIAGSTGASTAFASRLSALADYNDPNAAKQDTSGLEGFFDGALNSLAGAGVSAFAGFYNTGVSLAASVGLASDDAKMDVHETVKNLFGQEAADFYAEHSAGLDLVGFLASSIIPASLAMKGLRLATEAGYLGRGLQLSSGLKNADYMLGSNKMMENAIKVVSRQEGWAFNQKPVYQAIARGFVQRSMQGMAMSAAIAVTDNQNPFLDATDLSYFQAAYKVASDSLPYDIGFAGLGTVLHGAKTKRFLAGLVHERDAVLSKFMPNLGEITDKNAGDQLYQLAKHKEFLNGLKPGDVLPTSELNDAYLKTHMPLVDVAVTKNLQTALHKIVGDSDPTLIKHLMDEFNSAGFNAQAFGDKVIGLQSAGKYVVRDLKDVMGFSSKQHAVHLNMREVPTFENLSAVSAKLGATAIEQDFRDALTPEQLTFLRAFSVNFGNLDGTMLTREQMEDTFISNFISQFKAMGFDNVDLGVAYRKLPVKGNGPTSIYRAFPLTITTTNATPSAAEKTTVNTMRSLLGVPKLEDADFGLMTELHELTHGMSQTKANMQLLTNKFLDIISSGVTSKISTFFGGTPTALPKAVGTSEAKGIEFLNQLTGIRLLSGSTQSLINEYKNLESTYELLFEANPLFAHVFKDTTATVHTKLLYAVNNPQLRSEFRTILAANNKDVDSVLKRLDYLYSAPELHADAGAVLGHVATAEAGSRNFPLVAKYLDKFGTALRPWNETRRFYNRRTGQILTNAIPGVNDFAGTVVKGNKVVVPALSKIYERTAENILKIFDLDGKKFSTGSMLEATAQFAMASKQTIKSLLLTQKDVAEIVAASDVAGAKTLSSQVKAAKTLGASVTPNTSGKASADSKVFAAARRMGKIMSSDPATYVGPVYGVSYHDIPMMEKILAHPEIFENAVGAKPNEIATLIIPELGREFSGKNAIKNLSSLLRQRKLELRTQMVHAGMSPDYISKYLNTTLEFARGDVDALKDGYKLLHAQNWDAPELSVLKYSAVRPEEYDVGAQSYLAQRMRADMLANERAVFTAKWLEQEFSLLDAPEVLISKMPTLTTATELRGFISGAKPEAGSLYESLTKIGKIVSGLQQRGYTEITNALAPWASKLARAENQHIKSELSLVLNASRRDWYNIITLKDGSTVFLKDAALHNEDFVKSLAQKAGIAVETADGTEVKINLKDLIENGMVTREHLQSVVNPATQDVLMISKELSPLLQYVHEQNSKFKTVMREAAEISGKNYHFKGTLFYPPKVNLKQIPHFAFIVPNEQLRGADPRKFMIYGESSEALANKIQYVRDKYGSDYVVRTSADVKEYKKLMGEYDNDLVFDSAYFDSSLKRSGEAAELAPSYDLKNSSALEDIQHMLNSQEKRKLRTIIETYYADLIANLKNADAPIADIAKSRIYTSGKFVAPDSTYAAAVKTMFNDSVTGGEVSQMFTRVNDFLGEYGSKLLNNAIKPLVMTARAIAAPRKSDFGKLEYSFTEKDLETLNKTLDAQGFNTPYKAVADAIFNNRSFDNSRSFDIAVKAWSNIVASFGLTLDMANNIINAISLPILLSPAIKEALEYTRMNNKLAYDQLVERTTVANPHSGIREPSAMKILIKATGRMFTKEGRELQAEAKKRFLVSDFIKEYIDMSSLADFEGVNMAGRVNGSIQKMLNFGRKWSGYKLSEEYTRYMCIDAAKQIADIRGITDMNEIMSIASGLIDNSLGNFMRSTRMGISTGVLGQSVSMYQNYFINYMQNLLRYAGDNNSKTKFAMMAGLQSSIFGIQSLPGFSQLNSLLTTGGPDQKIKDIYSFTNTDKPNTLADYAMYGMGSHAFIYPMDFYTRGDLAIRNTTIFPTSISDFPAVNVAAKVIANGVNVIGMLSNGANVKAALTHGLAHNSLSRPLQGLGTILQGNVTDNYGKKFFEDSNYVDHNSLQGLSFGAMTSRLLGVQPLNEAIIKNEYYRQKNYLAKMHDEVTSLGSSIRATIAAQGIPTYEQMDDFTNKYMKIHGDLNGWNAFWVRTMQGANETQIDALKQRLEGDNSSGRANRTLQARGNSKFIWDYYPAADAQSDGGEQ